MGNVFSKTNFIFSITGFPVINDPLYNHTVFGPNKGKGGIVGKTDAQLIQDLIAIHNAENWLGMDGDSELSMFNKSEKDGKEDITDLEPSPTPPTSAGTCHMDHAGVFSVANCFSNFRFSER